MQIFKDFIAYILSHFFSIVIGYFLLMALSGCTLSNKKGECVGILDTKVPGTAYEYSARNIILAVMFSETFIVPIIVLVDALECPIEE